MSAKLIRIGQVVLGAAVAAVFAATSASLAADGDKPFHFHVDPFDFEVLLTDVDTNSSHFDVMNAGRADERYPLRYRNSGSYAVTLDYNVIPHRFGNDGTMLHSNASGRGIFTISDTTQQTLQDAVEAFFSTVPPPTTAQIFPFLSSQLQPFIH